MILTDAERATLAKVIVDLRYADEQLRSPRTVRAEHIEAFSESLIGASAARLEELLRPTPEHTCSFELTCLTCGADPDRAARERHVNGT